MRKLLFFAVCFAAIALSGCVNDKGGSTDNCAIRITSTIDGEAFTRAAIDNFETGDEIGIYKVPTSGTFGNHHRANAKYVHSGGGNFNPAETGHTMYWKPEAVDFIAYHPYVEGIENDHIYEVDVTDQVDLLYSNNVTDRHSGNVDLEFHHQLAKVSFVITDANELVSLAGMRTVIKNMDTYALFDITEGELSIDDNSTADITATFDGVAANAGRSHALVLPTNGKAITYKVVFTLANNESAEFTMSNKVYEADKHYGYAFRLVTEGERIAVEIVGSSIHPWDAVPAGPSIDIIKEPGTPEGPAAEISGVNPASIGFANTGGSETIAVTVANDDASALILSGLTAPFSATVSGRTVTVSAVANTLGSVINQTLTISLGDSSKTVAVSMDAAISNEWRRVFEEDFSAASAGSFVNPATSAFAGEIPNFPTKTGVFAAGGALKFNSGSSTGSITSNPLGVAGKVRVTVTGQGWDDNEKTAKISIDGTEQSIEFPTWGATNKTGTDPDYKPVVVEFENVTATSTVTITSAAANNNGRIYIDNVLVEVQ